MIMSYKISLLNSIKFVMFIALLTCFTKVSEVKADKIPLHLFDKIQTKAKIIFKDVAKEFESNNGQCVWDYTNRGSEWFNNYNRMYRFNQSTIYTLGCMYGAYNFWSVWLIQHKNGELEPITFAYPLYISGYVEGQEDPSQLIGMTTTKLLCNPTVDEQNRTIETKCLGRGIGDYFSSGLWRYGGEEFSNESSYGSQNIFLLISFESDLIDDGQEKPVTLFSIKDIER